MKFDEYIANSNLAFAGGNYSDAVEYAKKAIELEPKSVDGYLCAGKAYMSVEELDEAITCFRRATDLEKHNGNCWFLLGYAQILSGNTADALKSLTKAVESNCDDALKGQIYKMMSMINTDQGDFKNALVNLEQAEGFVGLDYEILQQKAACYASEAVRARDSLFLWRRYGDRPGQG